MDDFLESYNAPEKIYTDTSKIHSSSECAVIHGSTTILYPSPSTFTTFCELYAILLAIDKLLKTISPYALIHTDSLSATNTLTHTPLQYPFSTDIWCQTNIIRIFDLHRKFPSRLLLFQFLNCIHYLKD